jgi:hypothetical protein
MKGGCIERDGQNQLLCSIDFDKNFGYNLTLLYCRARKGRRKEDDLVTRREIDVRDPEEKSQVPRPRSGKGGFKWAI